MEKSSKHMGVSENSGTPKSSTLIGFSNINHPFWGTTIFGNTHIFSHMVVKNGDESHGKTAEKNT